MTSQEPSLAVDANRARALAAACDPALAHAPVRPLGAGLDNACFLFGEDLVFRFPQRPEGVALLAAELALLPLVARRVPVAVPAPLHVGGETQAYPTPYYAHRLVPGASAEHRPLGAAQSLALADALGSVLRALHGTPRSEAEAAGATGDTWRRGDLVHRRAFAEARLAEVPEGDRARGRRALDEALAALEATAPHDAAPTVLCHGDLYARHVLLDDQGALAGVIDWGDVHLGDPATDLMVGWSLLEGEARTRFRTAYGGADEATWARARFRAVYHSLACVTLGTPRGDEGLSAWGRRALARLAPDPG